MYCCIFKVYLNMCHCIHCIRVHAVLSCALEYCKIISLVNFVPFFTSEINFLSLYFLRLFVFYLFSIILCFGFCFSFENLMPRLLSSRLSRCSVGFPRVQHWTCHQRVVLHPNRPAGLHWPRRADLRGGEDRRPDGGGRSSSQR